MEQVTEADKKWLAQLLDNDSGDIGINEDGEPYIYFSGDYETIKRAKSICEKIGISDYNIEYK
ncbi:MAG: hypothetical protein WA667_05235 [Candidatus Nitrosopolaris sp.]